MVGREVITGLVLGGILMVGMRIAGMSLNPRQIPVRYVITT